MRQTRPPSRARQNGRCKLSASRPRKHLTRGLRFRLTAVYTVFFALLLLGVSALFRQHLEASLSEQARRVLDQEWAAMKGYLKIERNQPIWFFDHDDPDEAFIVNRLRQVYFLADQTGEVLQYSDNYKDIGFDKPNEIKSVLASATPVWRVRKDSHGVPYLIRTGVVYDERHTRPYVVAIGRSL